MCTLCRRSLLAGERFRHWRSHGRRARPLCPLCEPAATRNGWVPEERARRSEKPSGLAGTVRLLLERKA